MIKSTSQQIATTKTDVIQTTPVLSLFTVLKPFEGQADLHQRNAIASWQALGDEVEILLFSDTEIPADLQASFKCFDILKTNDSGTPLLDEVFRIAAEDGRGQLRAYINADILLDSRWLDAIKQLAGSPHESFLAIGRRTELEVDETLGSEPEEILKNIASRFAEAERDGESASIMCKDYFVFTREMYTTIPEFAIGRGNWDNWMVAHAKSLDVPVVNIAEVAPVIHQKHGYAHVKGGRLSAYVRGEEARNNQRLAKGTHWFKGSTATWSLGENGMAKKRFPFAQILSDLPGVVALVRNLLFFR